MRTPTNSEGLVLSGPAGELEAQLDEPRDGAPIGAAVVCHPHPLHGGTMQNKVAHTLARALTNCGLAALRFNFRGVGESEGSFADGIGEVEDVLAAFAWAGERYSGLPLWLAGFSFGAAMSINAATTMSPAGLISIAPAARRFEGAAQTQPRCPWLIVHAENDELIPIDESIDWVNGLEPGPELIVFPDASHFFHGRLVELRETVQAFVLANLDPATPGSAAGDGAGGARSTSP